MASLGSALRSFWHTMTSYDRHSDYNSPYRSGRHVPLANGRAGVLASVTTASESRADVTSPYRDETPLPISTTDGNGVSPYTPTSPTNPAPYSPGSRSDAAKRASQGDGFELQSPGEIQMQAFQDGLPPPPPVSHSWKKIDAWAEENYPELFDQLGEGATKNDLNDLEHQLDSSLPQDVRDSLMIHDGQERGGRPTGIIFSAMLLDCEEIVQEWENWRKVRQEFLADTPGAKPPPPPKPPASGSSQASSSRTIPSPAYSTNPTWRQDLLARQDSCPPNAVQKSYAHPAWIPLARDWGGNNLAIDLAPGPAGRWGQIILMGRDYDTKYVVARSWAAFLALVSDDLNSGKWFVEEETGDLKLREFKQARVEPAYFDILRWRMDQKYGRRVAKRKSAAPNRAGSPAGSASPGGSPYASPTEPSDPRGRSMQRLSGNSPLPSPHRPGYGKPSPLARVTEESAMASLTTNGLKPAKLVEVDTPRPSEDSGSARPAVPPQTQSNLANAKDNALLPPSVPSTGESEGPDSMKTIEI